MKEKYKITVISDVHGRKSWRDIVNKEIHDTTKFVFLGDYFDSFDIPANAQLENFKDIIAFKKGNMDKVVLLMGNHDYHYIMDEIYSGYNERWAKLFQVSIRQAMEEDLIQMCYAHDSALFSHAGVSMVWLRANASHLELETQPVDQLVNNIFHNNLRAFKFTGNDPTGDSVGSSPIWIRPRSLAKVLVPNYAHVIGHTQQEKIVFAKPGLVLTDTLGTSGEYLQIENGNSIIKKLELDNGVLDDMPF